MYKDSWLLGGIRNYLAFDHLKRVQKALPSTILFLTLVAQVLGFGDVVPREPI